jgi:hypothetical protein
MATYKEVKGITVQSRDTDPVENVGSWTSGPAINTARFQVPGAGATQGASYIVGGAIPPASPNRSALHEQFDGSSWTEASDLGTARYAAGTLGTPSAALVTGGYSGSYTTATENWNGSSWTSGTASNTPRGYLGASGTTTDGLIYGGLPVTGNTEKYNGSAWTETGDLNTSRRAGGQSNLGSGSAAIYSGGQPPIMANVEQFNGSSWSETSDLNTAREHQWGFGTSTAQIVCGGSTPPYTAKTESWNGSTWTEVNDLGTASLANAGSGGGTSTSGIIAGQYTGSLTTNSEQWDFPPVTADILTEGDLFLSGGTALKGFGKAAGIPAATWATGGDMNVSSHARGGAGHSNTAALAIGADPSPKGQTELYNGTTWTELNDLNVGRRYIATFGTTTAAIGAGGSPGSGYSAKAESWGGTSWTEISDINTPRGYFSGAGVQTSGIIIGGEPTDHDDKVETWDGSSWTEVSELNTGVRQFARAGHTSSNNALKAGGYTGTAHTANTEIWDGTAWTEVNNLNTSRYALSGDGDGTGQALAFGGYTSTNVGNTESWNGSSWTEVNDMGTARNNSGGAGVSASALVFGAYPTTAATEEFTADNTLADVTVS